MDDDEPHHRFMGDEVLPLPHHREKEEVVGLRSCLNKSALINTERQDDRWSSCFTHEAGRSSVKLELYQWRWRMMRKAGGGLYSVMSRRRFRLVYRHVMYSRQCARSYDSGGGSRARGILTRGCTKTIVSGKGGSHSWISQSIVGLSSYIMQCVLPFAITIPIKTHHSYYSHSISLQSVITGGNKPFWEANTLKSHKAQKSFNSWLLQWHL